jgi:hypothetical protein
MSQSIPQAEHGRSPDEQEAIAYLRSLPADPDHDFLRQMRSSLKAWGHLSPKQAKAVLRIRDERKSQQRAKATLARRFGARSNAHAPGDPSDVYDWDWEPRSHRPAVDPWADV